MAEKPCPGDTTMVSRKIIWRMNAYR